MSNKMITAAWDVPLPAHARLVLIALADSASEDEGVCWISNRTLSIKSCSGKSTVGYILAAFERLGIAVRETRFEARKNGAQTSSIKRITIPVFSGTDEEIATAKGKFAAEYDSAYAWARSRKDTPSHEVVGEGCHAVDAPHTTLCGTPHTTLSGTLEPSDEPSLSVEEEEDVAVVEIVATTPSQLVIPMAMQYLPASIIEQAIDKAVVKLARRSPAGYRRRLLEGLAAGDAGWIETVSEFVKQVEGRGEAPWQREKRLKREQGEAISAGLHQAGFGNIFDFLESNDGGVA